MANFLGNLWSKAKGVVSKVVQVAGNVAGTFIGVPTLGTIASGLLDKIPVKTMAVAATAAGVVNTAKVAETLVNNGIAATPANINGAVEAIQKTAISDPSIPTSKALAVDPVALTGFSKVIHYIQTYWYVSIPVIGYVLFRIVKLITKK